jgi:phage terminase small subunit
MTKLTPKQARFVEEYLFDLNATQAAIRAGYSERTANQQGPRLLENVDVLAAIDAAKLARRERAQINSDYVLDRLVEEVEADLADLYDSNNNLKPIDQWPDVWRRGLVAGVEIEALFEGQGDNRIQVGYTKKLRLSDRLRRLELIGKHIKVNAFQEQVHHTGIDSLGDRLERAAARMKQVERRKTIDVAPLPPTESAKPPVPAPAVSSAHETSREAAPPVAAPQPAGPPPTYRPIMPAPEAAPWPSFCGTAQADYDVTDT